MPSYFYMNDFPLSVAKGGKEEQLRLVSMIMGDKFDGVYNIHDNNAPQISSEDTLHCFGDTPLFFYFVKFLEGKKIAPNLVISPSFYRRKPYFYKFISLIPRFIPNWFSEREKLFKSFDKIIVNSEFEKRYLSKIFALNESKIIVVYNSFDVVNTEVEFSAEDNKPYCLCVSHLSERKNILNLLLGAEQFYKDTGIPLLIAGEPRFHKYDNLVKFEKLLKSCSGVKFIGLKSRDELSGLYRNCLFHILPSFIETPGISNLEAASFGKPIVVGDFPVLREYFGDHAIYSGFKVRDIYSSMLMASSIARSGPIAYDLKRFEKKTIAKRYLDIILSS